MKIVIAKSWKCFQFGLKWCMVIPQKCYTRFQYFCNVENAPEDSTSVSVVCTNRIFNTTIPFEELEGQKNDLLIVEPMKMVN